MIKARSIKFVSYLLERDADSFGLVSVGLYTRAVIVTKIAKRYPFPTIHNVQ